MPQYMFAYHGGGGAPQTPEEGEKMMKAWIDWMGSLGDGLVEGGNPVGMSSTLTDKGLKDGGGANPLTGYSIVRADTLAAAAEMGRGCPLVADGSGSIEIAEIIEM